VGAGIEGLSLKVVSRVKWALMWSLLIRSMDCWFSNGVMESLKVRVSEMRSGRGWIEELAGLLILIELLSKDGVMEDTCH
jgi:hypothetical protein